MSALLFGQDDERGNAGSRKPLKYFGLSETMPYQGRNDWSTTCEIPAWTAGLAP